MKKYGGIKGSILILFLKKSKVISLCSHFLLVFTACRELAGLLPIINNKADELIEKLQNHVDDHSTVSIKEEMLNVTLGMISLVIFPMNNTYYDNNDNNNTCMPTMQ